jgi:trehalose 6-phosphate synthase
VLSQLTSPLVQNSRWKSLARADRLALLVDLDGTLIEFAPTPDQAVLDHAAIELLGRVQALGIQVVVVSGRPRDSIESLRAALPDVWWVAEHGSWRWDPELSAHPHMGAPELDELSRRLASGVTLEGARFERKSLSFSVHWRTIANAQRAEFILWVESACDEWLEEHPGFERVSGAETLEVRLKSAHTGTAVNWIRSRLPGVRILAIGDDATDDDMFSQLDDGDACIAVGANALQADARAADVHAARSFLDWLANTRAGAELDFPLEATPVARARKRWRFLVMSNRTPAMTLGRTREVGGLVSALEPALRDENGVWLGWSGQERVQDGRIVIDASEQPVRARFDLPPQVRQAFYAGFCNRVLWPLFHSFPMRVHGTAADYMAYVATNNRFAAHALELTHASAPIWVHDYHLLLAARALRAGGHRGPIGLFLHIPFPSRDVLETIPWSADLIEAMAAFDLIGFQTTQSSENFIAACRAFLPRMELPEVGVFPATIDPAPFRRQTPELPEVGRLRVALGERKLILGVDRLDYSKGIPERLAAYERLLEQYPEWRRQVSLLQISVPTRAEIPDYAELRSTVESMVGRINGRFGDTDWVPVRYLYRSYDFEVLAQLYRLANVALVTPLRDGMNLVAKEFVAAQDPTSPGALVLSQNAGAAETLSDAIITNPFHPEGLAADLDRALNMSQRERVERHRKLLGALEREGDARVWAKRFLDQLAPRRLHAVD